MINWCDQVILATKTDKRRRKEWIKSCRKSTQQSWRRRVWKDSILFNYYLHWITAFASYLTLLSLTQLKSKTGGKSCQPSLPIELPLQTFLSPVSKRKSPKKIRKECCFMYIVQQVTPWYIMLMFKQNTRSLEHKGII